MIPGLPAGVPFQGALFWRVREASDFALNYHFRSAFELDPMPAADTIVMLHPFLAVAVKRDHEPVLGLEGDLGNAGQLRP